jgi:hypothetical protein
MRLLLCKLFGHKIRRHLRFFVMPGRIERCERCGRRVELG